MLKQDYIKRTIESLAAAVAALFGKKNKDPEEVLREVERLKGELPIVPGLLESAPRSLLARTLGDPELLRLTAELYKLEAEAHKQAGNTKQAIRCLKRSLELFGDET